jgi:hypothetical protein
MFSLTRDYYGGFTDDREKYGEIAQNPPHSPVANLPVKNLLIEKLKNFISDANFQS